MERTYIGTITPGAKYKISGFIENLRNKRTMAFLVVRDITGKIQVTLEKEKRPDLAALVDQMTLDSVITVEGDVVANDFVKMGGKELLPESIKIESIAEPLPIADDSEIDSRMDFRWIDMRREKNQLMMQMQTTLTAAMREFLLARNFVEIHTPKLIGAASESGSDVFEVKYFDTKAYLAQSPQFYKQMAMASGLDRIFESGPVFRAEKSYTNKHATEFTGFDLEFSYVTSCDDVMHMEEELLAYAFAKVAEKHGEKIKELFGKEVIVPTVPFPRMKLCDVYKELEERYGYKVTDEVKGDLTTDATTPKSARSIICVTSAGCLWATTSSGAAVRSRPAPSASTATRSSKSKPTKRDLARTWSSISSSSATVARRTAASAWALTA